MKSYKDGNQIFREKAAKRDAYRYVEASLDYGRGSKINRRNIIKEIEIKSKKNPDYAMIFDEEVKKIDRDEVFQKLQAKKKLQSTYNQGKKGVRLFRKAKRLFYDLFEVLG